MSLLPVLYDADCGFCRWSLAALLRWDRRGALLPVAISSPEGEALLAGMPREERLARAHVVAPDGTVRSGGDAVAPIVRLLPAGAPVAWLATALDGPTGRGYDWVAAHRTGLSRLVPTGRKDRATAAIERHRRCVLEAATGSSEDG